MATLTAMTNEPTHDGEFDPANQAEVERLLYMATRYFSAALAGLSQAQRAEVLEEAQAEAIIAALEYDLSTARTTKWKTAANRANTIVRKYLRELPRQPQNETDVLQRIRGAVGYDDDPEGDAGELDLTVLAVEDDDDGDYDPHDLTEQELQAEVDQGLATFGPDEDEQTEAVGEEIAPFARGADEDAEHFEMRRHLLKTATDPERTILERWTQPATEVGAALGLSGAAVRQRKTRLRKVIDAEIAKPGPLQQ
jgi:hypothetical protein